MAVVIQNLQQGSVVFAGTINRRYVGIISFIAALGGLLFGFDMVIISGAIPFLSEHFGLGEYEKGFAVGCINLGAAFGAVISGYLSKFLGRKQQLIYLKEICEISGRRGT